MAEGIVDKARKYVEKFYQESVSQELRYHNLEHTREIVKNIEEIARGEGLNKEELEMALLAGWFHDTGFGFKYGGHEKASAELADTFLNDHNYDDEKISVVKEAIHATDLSKKPGGKIDKVVRDADTLHVGKEEEYWDKMKALQAEISAVSKEEVSDEDALKDTIKFYYDHQFYTDYAQREYGPQKAANLRHLINKAEEEQIKVPENKQKKKKKKKQLKDLERGIQTMFRNIQRTHIQLSAIADNKANIMLSVNAIILSIVVANLLPKISTSPYLLIPTILLIAVCITSLSFAIMAVKPSVTAGRFTTEDVQNKSANLLFFGNFHKMPIDDFEWGMKSMMDDSDFLYSSMIRDFYHLGLVLAKKYRYLRICYRIFMIGIIVAALAFLIPIIHGTELQGIFSNSGATSSGPI